MSNISNHEQLIASIRLAARLVQLTSADIDAMTRVECELAGQPKLLAGHDWTRAPRPILVSVFEQLAAQHRRHV